MKEKPETSEVSAESEVSTPETIRIPPLAKHVWKFSNPDHSFSPGSVKGGLDRYHGSYTTAKGFAISFFNSNHGRTGTCPVMSGVFEADPENGFARFLHLGTTRIWNEKGEIDEDRWEQLIKYTRDNQSASEQNIIKMSTLKNYLKHCYKNDPPEENTGRNASSLLSSAEAQKFAASESWKEAYRLMNYGIKVDKSDPSLTIDFVRKFYEGEIPQPEQNPEPIKRVSSPR